MVNPDNQLTRNNLVAYHEAGHAVARLHLHLRFGSVTIAPSDDYDGAVSIGKQQTKWIDKLEHNDAYRIRGENEIVACLAGIEACKIKFGSADEEDASADDYLAKRLAEYIVYDDAEEKEALIKWLEFRTKAILRMPRNWRTVEALVKALIANRTISYKDAVKIRYNILIGVE